MAGTRPRSNLTEALERIAPGETLVLPGTLVQLFWQVEHVPTQDCVTCETLKEAEEQVLVSMGCYNARFVRDAIRAVGKMKGGDCLELPNTTVRLEWIIESTLTEQIWVRDNLVETEEVTLGSIAHYWTLRKCS